MDIITFKYACGLPDNPNEQGHFYPERWHQRLVREVCRCGSGGLPGLLNSSMLRTDSEEKLLRSECLKQAAKPRKAMASPQGSETEPEMPTEPISSSAGHGAGGQQVASEPEETQVSLPPLGIRRLGWPHRSNWQVEDYSDTMA